MGNSNNRPLLVAGGAGFIGSCFVIEAVKRGLSVFVLDALTYAGNRQNLEEARKGPGTLEFVQGNICDRDLVSDLFKKFSFRSVVNFAAESHVDRSIEGPAEFLKTNIFGTFTLLEASLEYYRAIREESQRSQFRYLQVSTDEVFGELAEKDPAFTEANPYRPNSPYSASKASADHFVRAWHHTYGLPTLITNCSNNYGPRQYPEKLIPLMISCALQGKPLPVYGSGKNIRDWIHVEDHCAGIFLALEKGKAGGTYCFGGAAERTNLEVVKEICAILDQSSPRRDGKKHETGIQFVTDRLGHDWRYAIDDKKARLELGFKRKYDFERGLKETVHWYCAQNSKERENA